MQYEQTVDILNELHSEDTTIMFKRTTSTALLLLDRCISWTRTLRLFTLIYSVTVLVHFSLVKMSFIQNTSVVTTRLRR